MNANAEWYADRSQWPTRAQTMRYAYAMSSAEAWLENVDLSVVWEDDWMVGSHVHEYGDDAYDAEPTTCELAYIKADDGTVLASLGCIDDADADYRREIEAELALEAMGEYAKWLHRPTCPTCHQILPGA